MSGKTKPRTRRRVWPLLDPVRVALNNATALTPEEKARLLTPPKNAYEALRRGQCTEDQWVELAHCCQVAICIEDGGIVKGLRDRLNAADQTLGDIYARATAQPGTPWRAPTLYARELDTVQTMLTAFEFQTGQLSAQEYRAAVNLAIAHQRQRGGELRAVNAGVER